MCRLAGQALMRYATPLVRVALRGLIVWLLCAAGSVSADCALAERKAAPPATADEWVVATANVWNFFDAHGYARPSKLDEAHLQKRVAALAAWIETDLASPHLLALQEVENLPLLKRLADQLYHQTGWRYQAILLEGDDPSGLDVGLLYRQPFVAASISQLYKGVPFGDSHRGKLFSRPPLRVSFEQPFPFVLVNVHLRSARDLHSQKHPEKARYVRDKRLQQATALVRWVAAQSEPVVLLGDMNSFPGVELFNESGNKLYQGGLASAWDLLPESERFSYVYRCQPQPLDHVLWSVSLTPHVARAATTRGNAGYYRTLYASKGIRPVSDHDAVLVYIKHSARVH